MRSGLVRKGDMNIMAKQSPLQIQVTSGAEKIGVITPAQLRAATQAPTRMALSEVIERFNAWKARINEPERVEMILVGKRSKV